MDGIPGIPQAEAEFAAANPSAVVPWLPRAQDVIPEHCMCAMSCLWIMAMACHFGQNWPCFEWMKDVVSKNMVRYGEKHGEICLTMFSLDLRAAAPAADPGRIGKEANQIGKKLFGASHLEAFDLFPMYIYCCEIYLIGLNFYL